MASFGDCECPNFQHMVIDSLRVCSAWTQAAPMLYSNEGPLAAEPQRIWDVPARTSPYPSPCAWVPMMETSISPSPVAFSASNTPPNAMPDFSHANTNEVHNSGNLSSFPGHEPSYDRAELASNPEPILSIPVLTTWSRFRNIFVSMPSAGEHAGAHKTQVPHLRNYQIYPNRTTTTTFQ
ncbi:hypothetical protein M413DRAFT_449775 [Hebeloma cylindrosporum]|uniref:Uncharacterized protein n=1 Tax=Hebeloma cylindrosporum TaxID=76867 RepID=A0A0C3BTG2_HEBCY|nr:hypothetical protein M413DRAFT_449775 [Hebeloma cylindrosporum h7]